MTPTHHSTMVLGGTGKTGRRVARKLRSLCGDVRIGSRSGEPPFDWEDPGTWVSAIAGAHAVYVTYQPDLAVPGAAAQVAELCAMATAVGVRRVVLLSGRHEDGALAGETAIRDSGLDWTVVRSSFFNQNFSESFFLDPIVHGTFAFPAGTVTEPFIDADDIAEVVVAALTEDRHVGSLYEVTGPELLTFADVVNTISEATGRNISYVPISFEEFADGLRDEGFPDDLVTGYTDLFATVLDGRNSRLSNGVERALGRPPRSFRDYADATAATGVWDARVSEARA